jgi:hypothetical protein
MIIASGPYLSPHFVDTVRRNEWPVVDSGGAHLCGMENVEFLDPGQAARAAQSKSNSKLLTSGEHALDWVSRELSGTSIDQAANLFKDKARFRRVTNSLFPDVKFRELPLEALPDFVPAAADYPFVVKPAIGFFSIGVRTIRGPGDWARAKEEIGAEVAEVESIFPEHMLSQGRFLLESYVEGTEFAVDAYYDRDGRPVVLNVLEHRYANPDDVSDRLYLSSREIIESLAPQAETFLAEINRLSGIRNFPLHAEFRRDGNGTLVPIEINPLRFGGWCTTGDFAWHAWGFNSYELYMNDAAPDWETVFKGRGGSEYGLVVLDNRTGIPGEHIRAFDYQGLLSRFSNPLHLSKMDFKSFPLFGFLFTETAPEARAELEWILDSDLREFVQRA